MIGSDSANSVRALACAAAFVVGGLAAAPALAESHAATCKRADIMSALGKGPMRVDYDGGAEGVLKVTGALGEFTLVGTLTRKQTEIGEGVFMDGAGFVNALMPDLAKLQSCIKAELAGIAAPNNDARLSARDACISRPTLTAASTPVTATVRFGIFPGDRPGEKAAIVSVIRKYTADASLVIESFPADCDLVAR